MIARVLIVDDEPNVLEVLSHLLTLKGFQVRTALRGEEAIELFEDEPTDVVITDLRMSGMDGLEVTRRIKRMDEDTEVIVLTGFGTVENAVRALRDEGAFDYLPKPLESVDELLITLGKALERRELRRENKALLHKLQQSHSELEEKIDELDVLHTTYKAILEGVPIGIALLDGLCRVLFTNARFADLLKLNDVQTAGAPLEGVLDETLRQELKLKEMLEDALAGKVAVGSEVPAHIDRPGSNMIVDIKAIPLMEADRKIRYILMMVEDVSQRIEMERKVRRMDRLSALGELSADIAHEIRNPLAAISSSAQFLSEGVDEERLRKDLIDTIYIGVQRMEKTIQDVLDFAGPRRIVFSKCSLEDIVNKTMSLITPQAKHKKIHLEVHRPASLPALNLDAAQIQQVLVNLLLNALRATPVGGKISVSLSSSDKTQPTEGRNSSSVLLTISDTGSGIQPGHLHKIFDPFFTTYPDGTGLGLAISHSILKEHKVDIRVESHVGRGTTFFLTFPLD